MADKERTDSPLTAEAIFQPWELVGESRRDCEPHRASLVAVLAYASLVCGGLSFVCPLFSMYGIALGVMTRVMARRDLDLIAAGDMDQCGYVPTGKAFATARAAVILSIIGPLLWLGLLGVPVLAYLIIRWTFG